MSFFLARSWRAFVLTRGDRHGANKNEIATFVFSITAKDFSHSLLLDGKGPILFALKLDQRAGRRQFDFREVLDGLVEGRHRSRPEDGFESEGVALIYGGDDAAIEAGLLLKDHLDVTVLIKSGADVTPPRVTDFPIVQDMKRGLSKLPRHDRSKHNAACLIQLAERLALARSSHHGWAPTMS
jgi:hypothetical protein